MKKSLFNFAVFSLALMSGSSFASAKAELYKEALKPVQAGASTAEIMHKGIDHLPEIHWITVPQIENSLKGTKPVAVGFDVDDTVMFSSPGFNRGKNKYSPGSNKYLSNPDFWHHMNDGWDKFDIPKRTVSQLIQAYEKHGDTVYFITARPKTKQEDLTEVLKKTLHIKNMKPVIFSGNSDKSVLIAKLHIKTFYGDSDSDIASAKAAGIQGIRVMRAENSSYQPLPHNGDLGEDVLVNSQY